MMTKPWSSTYMRFWQGETYWWPRKPRRRLAAAAARGDRIVAHVRQHRVMPANLAVLTVLDCTTSWNIYIAERLSAKAWQWYYRENWLRSLSPWLNSNNWKLNWINQISIAKAANKSLRGKSIFPQKWSHAHTPTPYFKRIENWNWSQAQISYSQGIESLLSPAWAKMRWGFFLLLRKQ